VVSLLTIVLTLVMLLSAVGFVVGGLVLAEEVLRPPASRGGTPAISRTRKVGGLFLLAIGIVLVLVAIVTGALIAEREAHLIEMRDRLSRLESRVQVLESKSGRDLPAPARPATQSP
jgi:uncharacterized membrane protein YidH (DUF202 family)